MKIFLEAPKEIVEQIERKKIIESFRIIAIVDDYNSVTVTLSFNDDELTTKQLVLWSGEAYADAGQYTDDDIKKRILELI